MNRQKLVEMDLLARDLAQAMVHDQHRLTETTLKTKNILDIYDLDETISPEIEAIIAKAARLLGAEHRAFVLGVAFLSRANCHLALPE